MLWNAIISKLKMLSRLLSTGWLKYYSQKQEMQVKTQVCVPGFATYSPLVLNKWLTLSTLSWLVLNMEMTMVAQRTPVRLLKLNCLVLSKHSDVLIAGYLYRYLEYWYIYTHTDIYIGMGFQIQCTYLEYVKVCRIHGKEKEPETSHPPFPCFPSRIRSCGPSWLNAKPQ